MLHRLATPDDFDFIYSVYMDEHANPYLTFDPMEREAFEPLYADLLGSGTLYVVEEEGVPVGTYRLIPKEHRQADTLYLGSFGVDAAHKGKGYGFRILEAIKQSARQKGLCRIELTVDVANEAAIGLYRKAGFEIEGRMRKSYRLARTGAYYDEYLMAVVW